MRGFFAALRMTSGLLFGFSFWSVSLVVIGVKFLCTVD
jgi:hypothetical protein